MEKWGFSLLIAFTLLGQITHAEPRYFQVRPEWLPAFVNKYKKANPLADRIYKVGASGENSCWFDSLQTNVIHCSGENYMKDGPNVLSLCRSVHLQDFSASPG